MCSVNTTRNGACWLVTQSTSTSLRRSVSFATSTRACQVRAWGNAVGSKTPWGTPQAGKSLQSTNQHKPQAVSQLHGVPGHPGEGGSTACSRTMFKVPSCRQPSIGYRQPSIGCVEFRGTVLPAPCLRVHVHAHHSSITRSYRWCSRCHGCVLAAAAL